MEFCPIVPTSLLNEYATRSRWQMCVAAWALPTTEAVRGCAPDVYWQFYKERVAAGDTVILDNGAWERQLVDVEQYRRMIEDLRPAVYVVPDVVGDYTASVQMADDFKHNLFHGTQRMEVFQGKHLGQLDVWMTSQRRIAKVSPQRWIGLSKGSQGDRVVWAAFIRNNYPEFRIHALGFIDQDPLGEIKELAKLGVGSCDSSEPVYCGLTMSVTGTKSTGAPFKDKVHTNFLSMAQCHTNLDEVFRLCGAREISTTAQAINAILDHTKKVNEETLGLIKGARRSQVRPRYDLIPIEFIEALAEVFEDGLAHGFGEHNWKIGDEEWFRDRLNHAEHHRLLYLSGDRTENHLAKMAWGALARLWWDRQKEANK